MPTDSSGNYTLPSSYFVQNGDPILPVQHNPPFEDLQQAQTDRVMRNGVSAMTGDLNMDGNKVVGLADGTDPADAATVGQLSLAMPIGAVMSFAMDDAPDGWLACRGQAVSRSTYAALFSAIGTTFGTGNGTTTFNLPNMRGFFPRGWNDTASGVDASRAFGSTQASQNLQHNHTATTAGAGGHTHTGSAESAGAHTHGASTASAGNHSHSGSTSAAGNHRHILNGRGDNNHGTAAASLSTTANTSAGSNAMDTAGEHTHSLTTNTTGNHTHSVTVNSGGAHTHTLDVSTVSNHTHGVTVANDGGSEARPNNIALLYCIKF